MSSTIDAHGFGGAFRWCIANLFRLGMTAVCFGLRALLGGYGLRGLTERRGTVLVFRQAWINECDYGGDRGEQCPEYGRHGPLTGKLLDVDSDGRVRQGSPASDGGAYARESNVLWIAFQLQIEFLILQIDIAAAADQDIRGINKECLFGQHALLRLKIHYAASDFRFLIFISEKQLQSARHIDPG